MNNVIAELTPAYGIGYCSNHCNELSTDYALMPVDF